MARPAVEPQLDSAARVVTAGAVIATQLVVVAELATVPPAQTVAMVLAVLPLPAVPAEITQQAQDQVQAAPTQAARLAQLAAAAVAAVEPQRVIMAVPVANTTPTQTILAARITVLRLVPAVAAAAPITRALEQLVLAALEAGSVAEGAAAAGSWAAARMLVA